MGVGSLDAGLAQSSSSEPFPLHWLRTPIQPVNRHPISVRPTAAQLDWLKSQRTSRGLTINALVVLALEQAMAANATPEGPGNGKA